MKNEVTNTSAESIFSLVGDGRRNFYCYSINRGIWFEVPNSELPQNNGFSITSYYLSTERTYRRRLLAVFGESNEIKRHYFYDLARQRWRYGDCLPAILGCGASITFDWRNGKNDAYLTIGGNRNSFYWNPSPFLGELSFGQQSFINNKKTQILYNSERIMFSYFIGTPSYGEISVYNLYGKKIKTLFKGKMEKGEYQLSWNKKDERGKEVSSGIYFIKVNLKERQEIIKVIIK